MKKERKNPKGLTAIIGAVIALIFVVVMFNPQWLPFSEATKNKIMELEKGHFLIEGSGSLTIAHILSLLLMLCILWLFCAVVHWICVAVAKKNPKSITVIQLIEGLLRYLVIIGGIVWGLSILGVNSTAVLTGVGLIGLIVGFGAQSLIEDVITGLFIIFERKYAVGDIIILDDFRGIVRDIGVRTTTIEDAGRNLKVVNNSDIRNFQNRSDKASLAICEVSVAYETDLPKMESMLGVCLPKLYENRKNLWLGPPRYLGVTELGDSGVLLKFVVDCDEAKIFDAQRALNRDIRVLFAEQKVEIPFPQVVVHQGD